MCSRGWSVRVMGDSYSRRVRAPQEFIVWSLLHSKLVDKDKIASAAHNCARAVVRVLGDSSLPRASLHLRAPAAQDSICDVFRRLDADGSNTLTKEEALADLRGKDDKLPRRLLNRRTCAY